MAGYRYGSRAGYEVTFEWIGGMDEREIMIPAILKQRGYLSAIYGKWDLGALARFLPISRGFDGFYGFVNTGIDYYNTRESSPSPNRTRPIHLTCPLRR